MTEETIDTHPSYGMIAIRNTSGQANLFGSSFRHSNYISIEVFHAEVRRHLHENWYAAKNHVPIVRLSLSPAGFTEMITLMNHGDGVPCTLTSIQGKSIEPCPESKQNKAQIHKEFEQEMKEIAKQLNELINVAKEFESKQTVSKKERAEFTKKIERIKQDIGENIPFIHSQFNEAMEKTVVEVKSEIESGVATVLRNAGMEKIQEMIAGANKQIEL